MDYGTFWVTNIVMIVIIILKGTVMDCPQASLMDSHHPPGNVITSLYELGVEGWVPWFSSRI